MVWQLTHSPDITAERDKGKAANKIIKIDRVKTISETTLPADWKRMCARLYFFITSDVITVKTQRRNGDLINLE
jgi:hypothetical protein